jgi:hypothetical protein
MSFHFRATNVSDFLGKEVQVVKTEVLSSDSDSVGEYYYRQLVVYACSDELASDIIEVKEDELKKEGDKFILSE